ncbi:MAG: response regulator [Betaproteobacteria bacterium]|nr:MAG: response regulator [Betaproteobacteria bacterium]
MYLSWFSSLRRCVGTLHARLLWLALLPAVLSAALFAVYEVHQSGREAEAALRQRGRELTTQLAEVAAYDLFTGSTANLQRLADHAGLNPQRDAIGVVDEHGRWWVKSGKEALLANRALLQTHAERRVDDDYFFRRPIGLVQSAQAMGMDSVLGVGAIGHVVVVLNDAPIRAAQRESLLTILTFLIGLIALAATMAWTLSRRLARRLHRITDTVHALTRGRLDARCPVEQAEGELRQLERDINDMAETLHDVHENLQIGIQTATAELTEQKLAAEAAVRAKSKFLAAASHDLRQPLHALTLLISALKDKVPEGELQRLTAHIDASATAMGDMLGGLLDLSRLDAGIVQAQPECFPVQGVLDNIRQHFAPTAAEKGLTLRVLPCSLSAQSDPLLTERIVMNLVSNAIRYTPQGRVIVGARRRAGAVELQVLDTGLGIAARQQAQVFEEYFQIDNPERQRAKGLGLGLAIVAREAELLGSAVTLRSTLGRGSRFGLTLARCTPIQVTAVTVTTDATATLPREDAPLIAILDDDTLILGAMTTLLREWGMETVAAVSAEALLDALGELGRLPDVILSDYRLPGERDGIVSVRWLRQELGEGLPAAIITGDTGPETIAAINASGLTLLHKPLKPARLRAYLNHALRPQ